MNLTAPTQLVFLIAVIVAIIALLAGLGVAAFLPISAFWLMTIAFAVLTAGVLLKGI